VRSLYALHPETVLQLHERGAAVYGQPLTLSLAETEDRMDREDYRRLVVDPGLVRSADEQRSLRRIAAVHPDAEIAWLRGRLPGRGGLALDELAAELRGEAKERESVLAVVASPGDAELGAAAALAVSVHLAADRDVVLVETDTSDPVYARRLRLRPLLAEHIADGSADVKSGWPQRLRIVAAPAQPELLLVSGMQPLLDRLEQDRGQGQVVVRASANLADRGLLAALAHASDILLCAGAQSGEYRRWLKGLAPLARLVPLPERRFSLRLSHLSRAGAELWHLRQEVAERGC